MLRRTFTHIGPTLLLLATCCATSSAAPQEAEEQTRIVGKPNTACPNAQYTTITDAINAAAPGDVIAICPALYAEQLIITKPLTLRGLDVNGVKRVVVQPSPLVDLGGLPFEAVITVMNTQGVTIKNLALDASMNSVSSCDISLAGIHFFNASGEVEDSAISGAQLPNPQSCPTLLGNGFGAQIDSNQPGPFYVSVEHNSIHDFQSKGLLATNAGVKVEIEGNDISGIGPASGVNQFGVFVLNGAVGLIKHNVITEGGCGALSPNDCVNLRSEGITLRAAGDGTVVDHNIITRAQSGIFINGGNDARITDNYISEIDVLDGIDIQGTASGFFTNSRIDGNTIFNALPIGNESCGIFEASGTGVAGNTISDTTVNDAYCGVAAVSADLVEPGEYHNTLYTELNADLNFPPPVEPGQPDPHPAKRLP